MNDCFSDSSMCGGRLGDSLRIAPELDGSFRDAQSLSESAVIEPDPSFHLPLLQ